MALDVFSSVQKRLTAWSERLPIRFSKNEFANRLGWQVLRVLWMNFRRRGVVGIDDDIRAHAETLRREGSTLIPDVLPPEVFLEIRAAYEDAVAHVPLKPLASPYIVKKGKRTRIQCAHFTPEPGTRLYELLSEHLMRHSLVKRLGATVIGEDILSYRDPQVFMNKKGDDADPDLNTDIYYHSDAPYPGVKAFYYLSDTDEHNGAFMYAKGSHTLTVKRLWWEYRKSIEWARNMRRSGEPGDEHGRAWHCLTRDEEAREGIRGTPMVGKANSLMMFNVMGFHRRGEITTDRSREFVLVYYRA